MCQTHAGDPELFNGWLTVSIAIDAGAIEFGAPDPLVAQQLASELVSDLLDS